MRGIGRVRRQFGVLSGLMLATMTLGMGTPPHHPPRHPPPRPARHAHIAKHRSTGATTASGHGRHRALRGRGTAKLKTTGKLKTTARRGPGAPPRRGARSGAGSLLIVPPALPARGSRAYPRRHHSWLARIPGIDKVSSRRRTLTTPPRGGAPGRRPACRCAPQSRTIVP